MCGACVAAAAPRTDCRQTGTEVKGVARLGAPVDDDWASL